MDNPDLYDAEEYEGGLFEIQDELEADQNASHKMQKPGLKAPATKFNGWMADIIVRVGLHVDHEARNLRDAKCSTSPVCVMIEADATPMTTATPTLNYIEDIFGIALQLWRRARLHDFTLPPEANWQYMVERFYWVDIPLGKLEAKESRLPNTEYSWHSMDDPDSIRENNESITK